MRFRGKQQKHTSHSTADSYTHLREEMVRAQIERRGIRNNNVLEAMRKVPRHLFLKRESIDSAYEDHALSIDCGQTMSQPYIVALMTDQLGLDPESKVLEIGTGCGYQTAVLAEIIDEVYTVEIIPELAEAAWKRLTKLGYQNIHKKIGNGYFGWEEHAPFDRIIITAAPKKVPDNLVEQLTAGGRMVVPVGDFNQDLVIVSKTVHGFERKKISDVRFVPMTCPPE
ncbi:MAG: protein-L-isoaspartate(D-aspartate) O-methyltransferase [Candidatus Poribacteria bacterium]|nr:protein-L-isoaspartate(D-aspartate) O-methyltransferase [Candidatus Poribacteria bacterium]